jgi:hypothetical protein
MVVRTTSGPLSLYFCLVPRIVTSNYTLGSGAPSYTVEAGNEEKDYNEALRSVSLH